MSSIPQESRRPTRYTVSDPRNSKLCHQTDQSTTSGSSPEPLDLKNTMSTDKKLEHILEIPFDMERSFARFSSSSRARGPERSFNPSCSAIPVRNFLVASTCSAVSPSAENVASRTAKNSSQLRSLYPINERNEARGMSPHPFSVIRR